MSLTHLVRDFLPHVFIECLIPAYRGGHVWLKFKNYLNAIVLIFLCEVILEPSYLAIVLISMTSLSSAQYQQQHKQKARKTRAHEIIQ